MRKRFRRRAAIEPVISHLKAHFRLLRCFLKGFQGDQLNLMRSPPTVRPFVRSSGAEAGQSDSHTRDGCAPQT